MNLSNWPVSRRLFAVIVAALVMGLAFGGLRIASAESSAAQFGGVSQLATLGQRLSVLIQDLQDERDATLSNLAASQQAPLLPYYAKTNAAAQAVQAADAGIVGSGFPVNIQNDVTTVNADISRIGGTGGLHTTLNPQAPQDELAVIANYEADITDIIELADQIAQGVSDASLTSDVRAFNALALAKEQLSKQRALLNYSFSNPNGATGPNEAVDPTTELDLQIASQEQFSDESAFQQSATPAERAFLASNLSATGQATSVAAAQNVESNVIANEGTVQNLTGSPLGLSVLNAEDSTSTTVTPAVLNRGQSTWETGMGDFIGALQRTETQVADNIATRAAQLHSSAVQSALIYGIIVAVVLLAVLLAALLVARSLVLPLRRLRAGALDIASVQLPGRVRLLSENPESAATMAVEPINVTSQDEIGQVARAFDQVHSEAVRLAGEQALLRSNFNAMFVNLSRRSQTLIERLARMIDNLEQNEDDPDRLGNLFSMDHLVTRMRRNSENLLLLAGHDNPRKWSDSIALADVARAATSEIEQYNRVTLNIPPGISLIGQAVTDVAHLLAELIENATMFSPKDTPVQVSVQELASGGVLIEIVDKGIGVSEARLEEMNWRLDNPPTIDVSVSRHMGLFAVARLAERHRVRVRLRPAAPQGLSALVWLPDSLIQRTGSLTGGWTAQPAGARSRASTAMATVETVALTAGGPVGNGYGSGNGYSNGSGNGYSNGSGNGGYGAGNGSAARTPSGWFRGGQGGPQPSPVAGAIGGQGLGPAPDWAKPADTAAEPPGVTQTAAGLPVRVPKASAVSAGAAPDLKGASPARVTGNSGGSGNSNANGGKTLPQRSPEQARSRLAGFQRGTRRAEEQGGGPDKVPRAGEGTQR
jgi:signal transduction histidine kinase